MIFFHRLTKLVVFVPIAICHRFDTVTFYAFNCLLTVITAIKCVACAKKFHSLSANESSSTAN